MMVRRLKDKPAGDIDYIYLQFSDRNGRHPSSVVVGTRNDPSFARSFMVARKANLHVGTLTGIITTAVEIPSSATERLITQQHAHNLANNAYDEEYSPYKDDPKPEVEEDSYTKTLIKEVQGRKIAAKKISPSTIKPYYAPDVPTLPPIEVVSHASLDGLLIDPFDANKVYAQEIAFGEEETEEHFQSEDCDCEECYEPY